MKLTASSMVRTLSRKVDATWQAAALKVVQFCDTTFLCHARSGFRCDARHSESRIEKSAEKSGFSRHSPDAASEDGQYGR